MTEIKLGKVGSLDVSADPSAVVGAVLMAAGLAAAGYFLLDLPVLEALIGGFAATYFHFDSELFHQMGHARAARKAGYPMTGVRLWALFGASVYPPDEPELPAEIHIRRALGGPSYSAIMTVFMGLILYVMTKLDLTSGVVWTVFVFLALDNLLVFTLGAFLPLGFTDGSTLLRWWPKRGSG